MSLSLQLKSLRIKAAKASLEYYTEYLGYVNAPFHREWYEFLQPQNDPRHFSPLREHPCAVKKYHQEAPRKHAKSECFSINYPAWLIGNKRDIKILIISETGTLASQASAAIKRRIEGQGAQGIKHQEIFGDMTPNKAAKWTDTEFTVRRTEESKFPTLRATGQLGSVTGGGFDLIIVDDFISAKTVLTKNQIEKTRQWFFEVVENTLFPWGAILVIGTRWSYADLYGELIRSTAEGGKGWKHQILKAILNEQEITRGAAPQVLWPEFWSYERLQEKHKEIGTLWFNCQWQNDPTGLMGDMLRADWLHEYEVLPSDLRYYAGVDPALGEGDKQAISTYGVDVRHRQLYLIDVWCDVVPLNTFLSKLNTQHTIYKYLKIFVEANSFQKVLFYLPELKHLPMVPVVTTKDKQSRFITMSSHFEAGRILVDPMLKNPTNEFYAQWVQCPRGQNDDALDAAELPLPYLIKAPGKDRGFVIG